MRIDPIQNTGIPSQFKGVYFTETGQIFLKDKSVWSGKVIEKTNKGTLYPVDTKISEALKDRFRKIPYIEALAKQCDVFIHFVATPRHSEEGINSTNISTAKIIWTDYMHPFAKVQTSGAASKESVEDATNKLINNITEKNFSGEVPSLQKIFI